MVSQDGAPPEMDWKRFQDVAASIERVLGDKGSVESPARLQAQGSKQRREIDVLIRLREGTREIKIALECRRRRDRSDVTWIEQLVGKRDNLGLDRIVAVSAKPFSEGAIRYARDRYVELMELAEFYDQDWQPWLGCEHMVFRMRRWDVTKVFVGCVRQVTYRSWDQDGSFAFRNNAGQMVSLDQIWNGNTETLYSEMVPGDVAQRTKVRMQISDDFPLDVKVDGVWERVGYIDVLANLWVEERLVPLRNAVTYRNVLEDQVVAGYTETESPLAIDGRRVYIGLAKVPDDHSPKGGGKLVIVQRLAE